jgi:hypothetical protein
MGAGVKLSEVYEKKVCGFWVACGYSLRGLRVGISVSKYEATIDLFVVWVAVEF